MVIINGRVLTMEEEEFRHGFVRIRGRYIEEVGDMASFTAKEDDGQLLDAEGAWVMPCFPGIRWNYFHRRCIQWWMEK